MRDSEVVGGGAARGGKASRVPDDLADRSKIVHLLPTHCFEAGYGFQQGAGSMPGEGWESGLRGLRPFDVKTNLQKTLIYKGPASEFFSKTFSKVKAYDDRTGRTGGPTEETGQSRPAVGGLLRRSNRVSLGTTIARPERGVFQP